MDWILALILAVGGYHIISLILAHRERMAQLKMGIVPKDEE